MSKHNVFVYGTLKKDKGNSYYLRNSKFVGNGIVQGFTMVNLGSFPGAIDTKNGIIHGEIYEVDQDTLINLDRLEGYNTFRSNNFYTRQAVNVILKDGSTMEAYMYTLPEKYLEKYNIIENGNWE